MKTFLLIVLLSIGTAPINGLNASNDAIAQNSLQHQVSGKIIDEKGEPIPGTYVKIKGSAMGVVADADGHYAISAKSGDVIVFSFMGFTTQEAKVGSKTSMDITLHEDSHDLNAVVVIGYGTQKKSDIISSVASVKASEMVKNITLDIGQMLRGKAAGVSVTTSSAAPGGSSSIQIRGVNSINGGTAPIIICDGVQLGDINNINPNDIESVEVLKDAAAQAIYGARAANGVILVTTKRGSQGMTTVNYNGYYGIQHIVHNFETYTPEEYIQYKREAYRTTNGGQYGDDTEVFSQAELNSIAAKEYIDWQKEVMRTGNIQSHNVSVTVGNDRLRAYVSGNYQKQRGIVKNTDYQKGNLRVNLDLTVNRSLSIGANTLLSIDQYQGPTTSTLLRDVVTCSPLGRVRDDEGNLNVHPTGLQENWNPLTDIYGVSRTLKNRNDLVNLFFDWQIIKGLKYRLNLSRRSWNNKGETYNSSKSRSGSYSGMGSSNITNQQNQEWSIENILTYNHKWGFHHFDATAVQAWTGRSAYSNTMTGSLISNDLLGVYGIDQAGAVQTSNSGSKRKLISTALRLQYNYDSRYYLTASVRRDGSSVFGSNHKWGYFPSAAIGWNIYQEPWLINWKPLTNLKLRASYGSVGNEAISEYGSIASADQWDYYTDNRHTGYAPGAQISNPNLKWETTSTLNLALDFAFFNNRLSGTIEWYKARTTDLLVNRSINSSSGYSTMRDNIGEVQNRGFEAQLNAILVSNENFDLRAGLTFSTNRNKISKLFGDNDGNGVEDDYPQNNWFIGQPISVYRYYKVRGIWSQEEYENGTIAASAQPTAEPGMVKLWDKDEDDKIGDEDRIIVSKYPKWQGSLNLSLSYKMFDFSADISTVQGITKLNPFLYDYNYGGNMRATFNGIKVDYWTPETPNNTFPRPTTNGQNDMTWLALEDASYWRLQNIQLGYTLPMKYAAKMRLQKLRLYATAQNLWTITDFHSYSPEQTAENYPDCRCFSFGIQLSF